MCQHGRQHLWHLSGIKINSTRWWSYYWIKSQLSSVDMREGIEGRLFPDSAERCDRSIQGKKRGDISDLSPVESKWINPSYRNHGSWLHPSNAKLHYTETTAARCVPRPSYTPPPPFVSSTALYYPWWKYNLPLICVPKPYKSKSSKVATFLHRYYVATPIHPLPIQPRKINYKGLGLAFFCYGAPERWVDGKKQLRDDRKEEKREQEKKRGEEITLSSARWWQQNTVEERASRHLLFTTVIGLSCCFQFLSLSPPHIPLFFFSSRCGTSDSPAQVSINALTPSYLHLQPVCDTGSAAWSAGMESESSLFQIESHPANISLRGRVWMFNMHAFVAFQLRLMRN